MVIGRHHAAANVDRYAIRDYFVSDFHCSSYDTSSTSMYIRHDANIGSEGSHTVDDFLNLINGLFFNIVGEDFSISIFSSKLYHI